MRAAKRARQHKGFKDFVLENYDPARVEQITGVLSTTMARLAGEFATTRPAVAILPGKGGLLDGGFGGVHTAMAVHILNALVGSLEVPDGVMTQRYMPCVKWPALPADPVAAQGLQAERVDGAGTQFPLARSAYQAVADRILAGAPVEALPLRRQPDFRSARRRALRRRLQPDAVGRLVLFIHGRKRRVRRPGAAGADFPGALGRRPHRRVGLSRHRPTPAGPSSRSTTR